MIGYKALETRLKQMWARCDVINIIYLGNDYCLVDFSHEDNKNATLSYRPWFIYDHYLTMKDWSPDFHHDSDAIEYVAWWIGIVGLPNEYYESKRLSMIRDIIGKIVKVDKNTTQVERGAHARICVEVNLIKPLIVMVSITWRVFKIEYEGFYILCLSCGKFWHYKEGCLCMRMANGEMHNGD